MIRINLTGDYDISGADSVSNAELVELDAFLGALRGSVNADKDVFLKSIADLTKGVKRSKLSNLALQVSSKLTGDVLTHEFRIVNTGQ